MELVLDIVDYDCMTSIRTTSDTGANVVVLGISLRHNVRDKTGENICELKMPNVSTI